VSSPAQQIRTARQHWARPGSGLDRIVWVARLALPIAAGVLGGYLFTAPMTMAGEVSFVLDKNKVEVARERMRLQAATYRGEDGKGAPFILQAGSAVQRTSADPVVVITTLNAQLQLKDGPAHVSAPGGRYLMNRDAVNLDGPIRVDAPNGYRMETQAATLDLKNKRLASPTPVTGTTPQGTFSGNQMSADLETHIVRLDGHARLRIVPRHAK
jgi:lipopolysaccharide export system protein LptC